MEKLRNFEYLVGNGNISQKPMQPYDELICNFIGELSIELNLSPLSNKYSDIKTLAFWCRKKNIINIKKNFISNETRLGLGLVFHITPSNIPTNFAYSLIFGLICRAINKILKKKYKTLRKMILIVRYTNNDNYTRKISSICNARIIWGGDNSIRNIRKFEINQRSLDIAFADRYSFCAMGTMEILKLNNNQIQRLVEKFYNDTYLVDQNACSSPHLILWLGRNVVKARKKFWKNLYVYVDKKYHLTEIASIDKYTQLCRDILSLKNMKKYERYGNSIYTIQLNHLDKELHNLRGKWGFFYEYEINNLNKIKNYINNKYQTLTYFGLNKNILKDFILKNKLQGIDRVVPVGQALDISFFWDGYDLNRILTRVVDIK